MVAADQVMLMKHLAICRRMSKMTRTGSVTESKLLALRRKNSLVAAAGGPQLERTHSAPLSNPAAVSSRFGRPAADAMTPRPATADSVPTRSMLGTPSPAASPLSTGSSASYSSSWPPGACCLELQCAA